MTPLERAQRAVAQWDYHWMKSLAVNVLLMNIKREIEEAVKEAVDAALLKAELQRRDECSATNGKDVWLS